MEPLVLKSYPKTNIGASMISYHLEKPDPAHGNRYFKDFKVAETNDVARVAKGILSHVWSPIRWADGRRRQDNFLAADWCVLDFDSGEMSLEQAKKVFCDSIHIIGTTKSHQVEKDGRKTDRFRVLVRFEARITSLKVYRWNMHRLLDRFPEADSACQDGARFFYPCRQIVQLEVDGFMEEVDFDVPPWFGQPPPYEALRAAGLTPSWTKRQLATMIPPGERNNTIYRIAKDLTFVGDSEAAILSAIIDSPTYKGQVSEPLLREITDAVRSGRAKALVEMQGWKGEADER